MLQLRSTTMGDTSNQVDAVLKQAFVQNLSPSQMAEDDSRETQVVVVSSLLIAIVSIVIFLRLYARIFVKRTVSIDDLFMIIAGIFAVASNIVSIIGTDWGSGSHVWNIPTEGLAKVTENFKRTQYMLTVFNVISITFAKWSIISMYLRIFPNRIFRIICLTIAVITIAQMVITITVVIFECIPIQAAWDAAEGSEKCIDIVLFFYFAAALDVITDILLVVAPLPLVHHLNLSRGRAIVIGGLFLLGVGVCVAGILRLVDVHQVTIVDWFYAAVPYTRWALVECAAVIVCGSIPAMRPFVRAWYPSTEDIRRQSKSSGSLYPDDVLNTKVLMDLPRLNRKVSYSASKPSPPIRGISRDDIEEWERLLREGQAKANSTMVMHPPPPSF